MDTNYKLVIEEVYGDCCDIKELIELHKNVVIEAEKQFDFVADHLYETEIRRRMRVDEEGIEY